MALERLYVYPFRKTHNWYYRSRHIPSVSTDPAAICAVYVDSPMWYQQQLSQRNIQFVMTLWLGFFSITDLMSATMQVHIGRPMHLASDAV